MPPSTGKGYLLNGPADWDSFEQSYIMKVSAERVYELGRLNTPAQFIDKRITEPRRPEFSDYLAREQNEARSRSTNSSQSTVRSSDPATSYVELVPEDQEAYKASMAIYKSDLDRYNKQADGIRNVLNWMIEKINPHYYFELLKLASNSRTNWEDWITSWEKAMRIAKLRGVAEAQHSNTWFEDLQQNLDVQFRIFLRIEQGQNKDAIEAGTYLPLTFSAQFRQEIQSMKRRSDRNPRNQVAKGSFKTTFQDSSPEIRKRSRSSTGETKISPGREGSAKRPRASIELELCILCEKKHKNANTTSCWVAFPEKAPKKYPTSQRQLDLWEQRLEDKKEVRELFEKLQQEKQDSKENCKQFGLVNIEEKIRMRREKVTAERTIEEILEELKI
ncbi:hypothetical protein CEK26_011853 [Fusarium fujikuroi]|nr:hypothetical protein CEK27_004554 [Fusarium fujikuroi]QGI67898.1 hypothetical protein CEK27_011869 [Fusarium fujikuroi]QGI91485.1 hypothetical protein CEK26_004554 [Fusarium fujikuroi]QGI98784.1 hypothetical protein CEK26_011853 [Fusarium fujikuroi]